MLITRIIKEVRRLKDRLTLAILLVISWIILFIFQKYMPIQSAVYVLFCFMFLYSLLIYIGEFHKKRKIKKLIKKGLYKDKSLENADYEPFVSIIIPAHNEEKVIKSTIENILAVDYTNYELLIVDDRSDDSTAEVLKELNAENPKIKYYIRCKNAFPGKSAVMNEAFSMTQGDIICIFDADARIEPDFFKKILPYMAEPEVGAVQARKIINNREINFLTRCQDNEYILDTHFQTGRDSIKGAVELRGNGQLIKRKALVDIDGWNNFTITDDLDISTRLHLSGWDIRFAEEVNVYEEGITGFLALLRQRRRWIEGSIRRYLDYSLEILTSKKIPLRVSIDMFAFISEFIFPVWLLSEYCIQGFRYVKGIEDSILYTLLLLPVLALFFTSGLVFSLKKYKRFPILKTLKQSIETGIYMVFIWVPMVSYIVLKIIFSERTMDWGKTDHGADISDKKTNTYSY